ncbi:hypothetical protein CYY_002141 [Polysphondylium violaceum]|uniref:Uncharacterized protein n=1 Tax=Polysphondylium violaceum TaxID=133409 RepID=A0A8J4Q1R6_9MYCE|nr:hypothetical protein CYY_002141 [Polysphondylium violaceum]
MGVKQSLPIKDYNLEQEYEITDEEIQNIFKKIKEQIPMPDQQDNHSSLVNVVDLSDYVNLPETYIPCWGLRCRESNFHLIINLNNGEVPADIILAATHYYGQSTLNYPSQITIGNTHYGNDQIIEILQELMKSFGGYHKIFWNSSKFINTCLSIICEGEHNQIKISGDYLRSMMFGGNISMDQDQIKKKKSKNKSIGTLADDKKDLGVQERSNEYMVMTLCSKLYNGSNQKENSCKLF